MQSSVANEGKAVLADQGENSKAGILRHFKTPACSLETKIPQWHHWGKNGPIAPFCLQWLHLCKRGDSIALINYFIFHFNML